MLNIIYKLMLTAGSTFWMISLYVIKSGYSFILDNKITTSLFFIFVPVVLSGVSLKLFKTFRLSEDNLNSIKIVELADNNFLPVYLGYFFVALSINNEYSLFFVYVLVFIFVYLSQSQYFNPVYLLLKYHYYNIETSNGTRIFLIYKGRVIRKPEEITSLRLNRINDTTYIAIKEK